MKKTKAFTTMELGIVMLMAGLISTMAYGGYSFLVKQFHSGGKTNSEAIRIRQCLTRLKTDVNDCERLKVDRENILCEKKTHPVEWSFENEHFLLRTQAGITDTFFVNITSQRFVFRGKNARGIADEIQLTTLYHGQETTPVFVKRYSAQTLMEEAAGHGH